MQLFKWLWRFLFLALTLIGAAAGGIYYGITQPILIAEPTTYEVQPGYTPTRIGSQMAARGWIYHPLLVRVASRLNPQWVPKMGEYELTPGMTVMDVLAKFDSGQAIHYSVTLLEGKTTQEFLETLANKRNIEMTLLGQSNNQIAASLELGVANAEGQFFADTYRYFAGDTDVQILKRANAKLNTVLMSHWAQKNARLPFSSAYDALIMASIIEKETGAAHERPLIAKVFFNRLKLNIRLQTDPTVIYGLGDSYDGNLTRKGLRSKSPYNTYRIYGLPPTPIANVGEEAIAAAINPGETDALYFVAKGDGTHEFSRTLKEHNAAVAKYQRFKRRSDYTSSPAQ